MCDNQSVRYDIPLNFKGSRRYIQGGSLYDAVDELAKRVCSSDCWVSNIVFRGFALGACAVCFGNEKPVGDVVARFSLKGAGELKSGVVIKVDGSIEDRVEYDESWVTKFSSITEQSVVQKKSTEFTSIEEVVSLTKYLHNECFPLEDGKWVFVQLDLDHKFSENELLVAT